MEENVPIRAELIAIGTELLLGTNVDTNSAWISEHLAAIGVGVYLHTSVGDNHARIVDTLRAALERADVVLVTGGLGPTQDDITREAIAEVMGVSMFRDPAQEARIRELFERRKREMPLNNLKQADRPEGSSIIESPFGTAPGLICPVGDKGKVIYAMPGVPREMKVMMESGVLPDLISRSGGVNAVIASRTLRTWGVSESRIAEMVEPRIAALDDAGNPTIAFLAKASEGIFAHGATGEDAQKLLEAEENELRSILGDLVFGTDDIRMEDAVGDLLRKREWTIGVAESVTGGMIASRLTNVLGASDWLRGGVVSYASDVKFDVLDVPEGPVVTPEAAIAMADGVRSVLKTDVGLSVTGVAGPTEQEGQPVGTVYVGIARPDTETISVSLSLAGDRQNVRDLAAINALNELRLRLS
jgi:nicotinamide-nucleotide amidase